MDIFSYWFRNRGPKTWDCDGFSKNKKDNQSTSIARVCLIAESESEWETGVFGLKRGGECNPGISRDPL